MSTVDAYSDAEVTQAQPKPIDQTRAQQIARVIERMDNGESERSACEAESINRMTFRCQVVRYKAEGQYARALEGMAADQVVKMEQAIQDMRDGTIDAQQATVEINARKWFASKFLPRVYGEKLDLTAQTQVTHVVDEADLASLSSDERDMLRQVAQTLLARKREALEDRRDEDEA